MVERSNELASTLKQFYNSVNQLYPVKKMLLYGSYAKGTMHKDSDIDVAVIVDRIPGKNRIDITSSLFTIARHVNYEIEPKCIFWDEYLNPPQASILSEIIRTGKEIEG